MIVIAVTQKPSTDIIPSSLRDLFGHRWALRCTTPTAPSTILGAGWATNGNSAATLGIAGNRLQAHGVIIAPASFDRGG